MAWLSHSLEEWEHRIECILHLRHDLCAMLAVVDDHHSSQLLLHSCQLILAEGRHVHAFAIPHEGNVILAALVILLEDLPLNFKGLHF